MNTKISDAACFLNMLDLSPSCVIDGATHLGADINQLYHPTGVYQQDSYDLVYANGNINTTKFSMILLKEWFYLVQKGGCLIIDYLANDSYGWQKLEKQMYWLWKGRYSILYHGPAQNEPISKSNAASFIHGLDPQVVPWRKKAGHLRFVCRKEVKTMTNGDDINKWAFGIITNGKRNAWIDDTIESIKRMNVPEYEILVCGSYKERNEKNFRYIPFSQRDDKGWISKKKNLIVDKASYENICIVHDRLYFDLFWYDAMKKWGNCFESLSVPQVIKKNQKRFGDWCCLERRYFARQKNRFHLSFYMDYSDWDECAVGFAGVTIAKKRLLSAMPFDETLYWGEYEDLTISQDFLDSGCLLRMNPHAKLYSRSKSGFDLYLSLCFHSKKRGKIMGPVTDSVISYLFRILNGFKITKNKRIFVYLKNILNKVLNITTHKDTADD